MRAELCTACARASFIEGVFTGVVLAMIAYALFSWLERRG